MRISLCLLDVTADINFGDGVENNNDRHNHYHKSTWVSVVGRAATGSSTSVWTCQWTRMKRGCSRPGTGGCQYDDDNVGIGIEIGWKNKYSSIS